MVYLNKIVCRSINSFCVLSKIFPERLTKEGIYSNYMRNNTWNDFVILQTDLDIIKYHSKYYQWL